MLFFVLQTEYYMSACGYEFYLLVFNSISHSLAALTREVSSWTLEDIIRIQTRECNVSLYVFPGALSIYPSYFGLVLTSTTSRQIRRLAV